MTRLLFLLRRLDRGGAERQLVELVRQLAPQFDVAVATFYDGGPLRDELARIPAIRLVSLGKRGRWDLLPFLWRGLGLVRTLRPDVIHGWLGMANLLALGLGRLSGTAVMWGIRSAYMDLSRYDWLARLEYAAATRCARWADGLVYNSSAGLEAAGPCHVDGPLRFVVPNGIDTERFRPDPAARVAQRAAWGVRGERVVVLVGRLDPMKDHETFLRAAALVARERDDVRFVCVGGGTAERREALRALSRDLGVDARVTWEDERGDVETVYNGADLLVLSSYGEGFPNVLGEALACGTACVTTDVGDAARLMIEPRRVVSAGMATAMAAAILDVLRDEPDPEQAGRRRAHVREQFASARLGERYAAAITAVVAHRRRGREARR